ncbi:MAG TPA: alpha/beta hydrolase, partial [Acetobacteraceae bacterium]|nr:alpha/beta hydrolase [Acetobacteraceae bacterium]
MSQTTTVSADTPPTYQAWITDLLDELKLKNRMRRKADVTLTPDHTGRPTVTPIDPNGLTDFKHAGVLRSLALGGETERRTIDQRSQEQIDAMRSEGLAAGVEIPLGSGQNLRGNFFSAKGHNLKEQQGKPDTTRPLVLLLTGSGGSAQDQGLDMAKFYAENGANVLSVNYRGYGDSDNVTPTEKTIATDASAMLQHAIDLGYDPANIVIQGYSMGGAVAGMLKEAAESDGKTKLRGLVLDRPMLSMTHGVKARAGLPGLLGSAAGAISRAALGKFSARKAIRNSPNTDTRMVITGDEGQFAQEADDLRQELQNKGMDVTGKATGKDHFDHQAAINDNKDALKKLIEVDRGGTKSDLTTGAGRDAFKTTRDMTTFIDGEIKVLGLDAQSVEDFIAGYTGTTQPGQVKGRIGTATRGLQKALDLQRNIPSEYGIWLDDLGTVIARFEAGLQKLVALLSAPLDTAATEVLIDAAQRRCSRALAALTRAGGPDAGRVKLEN